MHLCALISRKKKSFTMRPQDASLQDTSLHRYSLTHLLTYVLTCLLGWLIAYLLAYLHPSSECILSDRSLLRALGSVA